MTPNYDALFLVSFGGPEGPEDVLPFLENVLRGKPVPEERKKEVASHYQAFGGISPINRQNREMIQALRKALHHENIDLPIYWGNRNWKPYIQDTLEEMAKDGRKNVLAYVTSAYSSYSGCRQYRENIENARQALDQAPTVDKIRSFFNHPLWIKVHAQRMEEALAKDSSSMERTKVLFTAHSLPLSMSQSSDYTLQLQNTSELIAKQVNLPHWELCYQSRSGGPSQPWLEPDVCDVIRSTSKKDFDRIMVHPVGFVSDHMEIIFDLDRDAKQCAKECGFSFVRSQTPGTHPTMIELIVDLIKEYIDPHHPRPSLGDLGPRPRHCPPGCCPAPVRPR
ncbi:MAG: ferrochelatase [Bdellovibrionota bacterium]